MTQTPSKPALTSDQVVCVYERRLNRMILWEVLSGFAFILAGIVFFVVVKTAWLAWTLLALFVLAGGMFQRVVVLRLRCPACNARALARIHSIVQARAVKECPHCKAKLRE